MITLEQVEKLREKTNVSFEEAKVALENANGDMLDAMIYLEKQGKLTTPPQGGTYNTAADTQPKNDTTSTSAPKAEKKPEETFGYHVGKFFKWLGRIIHKGNINHLQMDKGDEQILSFPVTAFVLLLCFGFWVVLPLMVVALFCGCRFKFSGPNLGKDNINNVMNKAADTADQVKKDIKDGIDKE